MVSTVDISRAQFAFTIAFHILFPAFSIGLITFITVMEASYLATKNVLYLNICKFWIKVFALTFGMGVVSGLVMEVQLGTNWSGFSKEVGAVLGGLFQYEVMTAFFIEAGFLGIVIFGWEKVGPKLHFLATCLVWFGVTLSAFWILAANSWMQTPAGAKLVGNHFDVVNWWQVIFNHSTIIRYIHMMIAVYLTTSFVIAGISAFYLLRNQYPHFSRKCLSVSLWTVAVLAPLQIFIGDTVGLEVHTNQPIKTAAIEANWQTQRGAPLVLFAYPNKKLQKNQFAITVPHIASLINTHQWNGKLEGLSAVPIKDQPVVAAVFYSFRVMVAVGLGMMLLAVIALFLRFRKRLYESRWFLHACVWFSPWGFLAIITGWITAECGRQPWIVYNLMRTDQAASPVSAAHVALTFGLIFVVYFIVFGVFYFRYLGKVIKTGPTPTRLLTDQPFGYMRPKDKGEVI